MNQDVFKGKWHEIKGDIRKAWGNLTNDEIEKTKGDMGSIQGLIQQKYGDSKESISQRLAKIVDRYAEKAKNHLSDDDIKETKH